ncbi:Spindle and kinetochore-associated protein 1 [Gonapodya sp. JEL0774]|nr:Spindle and kinetochore-associated protein 1 [Gonapodya sp. JEL0774]
MAAQTANPFVAATLDACAIRLRLHAHPSPSASRPATDSAALELLDATSDRIRRIINAASPLSAHIEASHARNQMIEALAGRIFGEGGLPVDADKAVEAFGKIRGSVMAGLNRDGGAGQQQQQQLQSTAGNTGKKAKSGPVLLAEVTDREFATLPKYLVGRMTLARLNISIGEFNKHVTEKYNLLKQRPSSLPKSHRDRYWSYKETEIPEVKDKTFLTENDVKENWAKSTFRMDPQGRAIIAIARHLGKLKEVRGGGQTRFVVSG